MPSPGLRRKTIVLLLAAVLAFPWASSAGPRSGSTRATETYASTVLDLVGRAWSFLTGAWNKSGCQIDPDGRCLPGVPLAPQPIDQTDSGCYIDPSGGCRS